MRPAFWPDYYWPWTSLTDVHTKPRGMHEPLQYSEMMKLAIARGYQYFGYDPETCWDINAEVPEETGLGAADLNGVEGGQEAGDVIKGLGLKIEGLEAGLLSVEH